MNINGVRLGKKFPSITQNVIKQNKLNQRRTRIEDCGVQPNYSKKSIMIINQRQYFDKRQQL